MKCFRVAEITNAKTAEERKYVKELAGFSHFSGQEHSVKKEKTLRVSNKRNLYSKTASTK